MGTFISKSGTYVLVTDLHMPSSSKQDPLVAMAGHKCQPWRPPFPNGTCTNGVLNDWAWS